MINSHLKRDSFDGRDPLAPEKQFLVKKILTQQPTWKEKLMKPSKGQLIVRCLTRFNPPNSRTPLEGLTKVALIGMGFSANNPGDPNRHAGKSNEEIADIMAELWEDASHRGIETLVLPQREVAEALDTHHRHVPIDLVLREVGDEKHISSHDILKQAWSFATKEGVRDAVICAHQRHALRASWNAEMYGFTVHEPHRYATAYAPESTQLHTKNAPLFFIWELVSRAKLALVDKV